MTKKHFQALAEQLAIQRPPSNCNERMRQWENDAYTVGIVCERFNPRFDRIRFNKEITRIADERDAELAERE